MPQNPTRSHGALLSLASWAKPRERDQLEAASTDDDRSARDGDALQADLSGGGAHAHAAEPRSVRDLLLGRANGASHSEGEAIATADRTVALVPIAPPAVIRAQMAMGKTPRRGLMSRIGSLFGGKKGTTPNGRKPAPTMPPSSAADLLASVAEHGPLVPFSHEPAAQPDRRNGHGHPQVEPSQDFAAQLDREVDPIAPRDTRHQMQPPEPATPVAYAPPAQTAPQVPFHPLPVSQLTAAPQAAAASVPWHPAYGGPYAPPLPPTYPAHAMMMPQPASAHFFWPVPALPPVAPAPAWGAGPPHGTGQACPAAPPGYADRAWHAEHEPAPRTYEAFAGRNAGDACAQREDITAEIDDVRERLRDFAELLRELRALRRTG